MWNLVHAINATGGQPSLMHALSYIIRACENRCITILRRAYVVVVCECVKREKLCVVCVCVCVCVCVFVYLSVYRKMCARACPPRAQCGVDLSNYTHGGEQKEPIHCDQQLRGRAANCDNGSLCACMWVCA
jgi:hypothetical protein